MTRNGTAVRECFRRAVAVLKEAGSETPEAEARLLLGELFSIPAAEVPLAERALSEAEEATLDAVLRRRAAHEPPQYLLGRAFFYDLELEVTPAVLIPRPETELLAEWAISELPEHGRLLDLGTGSGALALAAAHARPDARITAVDISRAALEVAERNRRRLGCGNVELVCSDLFSALDPDETFDVVAANLPYVPEADRSRLAPEVTEHEPSSALFVPGDGTAVMMRAIAELEGRLVPGGSAGFELDPRQAETVRAALAAAGFDATIRRDLAGRERFVTGRLRKWI